MILCVTMSTSACDDNCNVCETNGAGKCDSGKCVSGYVFDADSKSCKGKSSINHN